MGSAEVDLCRLLAACPVELHAPNDLQVTHRNNRQVNSQMPDSESRRILDFSRPNV